MLKRFARWLSVILAGLSCAQTAHAETDWDPQNTWVFAVGILDFQNKEEYGDFPQKNRRDVQLMDLFRSKGVPPGQIVYLQDTQATLANIEAAFKKFLQRTDENSLLIVYYAGHGVPSEDNPSKVFFASYDSSVGDVEGWWVNRIVGQIESLFEGSNVILLADCCYSGALGNVAKRKGSEVNYACLSASTLHKSSTGQWTFTESILAALRGDAETDLDQDGTVTLTEMQAFAKREMAFGEDQKTAWYLSDTWSGPSTLADAATRTDKRIGAHVQVKYKGKPYKGRVTEKEGDMFKVFYYGYEASEAEWVKAEDIIWAAGGG